MKKTTAKQDDLMRAWVDFPNRWQSLWDTCEQGHGRYTRGVFVLNGKRTPPPAKKTRGQIIADLLRSEPMVFVVNSRALGAHRKYDMQPGQRVKNVRCTRDTLRVDLLDGRAITVPLAWYPRLLHATPLQRARWKIAGGGYGIHWPEVDEDLSVEGLLRGLPAPRVSVQVAAQVA